MAADDDNKEGEHGTPSQDTPPPTPPAPPAEPPADADGLRAEVSELKGIVTGLVEAVAALAPLPNDQTPIAKPWTHRTLG